MDFGPTPDDYARPEPLVWIATRKIARETLYSGSLATRFEAVIVAVNVVRRESERNNFRQSPSRETRRDTTFADTKRVGIRIG